MGQFRHPARARHTCTCALSAPHVRIVLLLLLLLLLSSIGSERLLARVELTVLLLLLLAGVDCLATLWIQSGGGDLQQV